MVIRSTHPLRRRKQSKLVIGQCAIVSFMAAIFSSYVVFMLEMTKISSNPPKEIPSEVRRVPQTDDMHDTIWALEAEEKEQERVRLESASNIVQEQPTEWKDKILRAYLEPIKQSDWEIRPLPNRTTAQAGNLKKIEYPRLASCKRFAAQFPIDDFPDADPFLPWIHDVFPTHNGKYIQIVAQNKRRCRTGLNPRDARVIAHMQPQIAMFQHVPVKRLQINGETRYKLSSHEEADPDGLTTRFICRFKPSMKETLSTFNVDYDYAAWRKSNKHTFSLDGQDLKSIHTSQLLFLCPVPKELHEIVRTGASVKDDFATQFLDIIPMRTPPRYGITNQFFPPWYKFAEASPKFDTNVEWGTHILPRIEDSGRWENIPICGPSLQTFKPKIGEPAEQADMPVTHQPKKLHRLSICTWASTGYHTRGDRFMVGDGARRMREWIHFNRLVGVEHFYIYDNSGAHATNSSLQLIADLFPEFVTIVEWPAKVCNNRPNNVDSPGERSSQYAAEASCRLRFGPYTDWLGGYDIDEYISPLGEYNSLIPLLDKLDKEGMKMINFRSWRSWPRRALIEEPKPIEHVKGVCKSGKPCFELVIPENVTILQTYNCDRQKGNKKNFMPAEKQLYKPDYVLMHFVHYSTVTVLSAANKSEYQKMTNSKWRWPYSADIRARFSDEVNEGAMLHSKAMATPDTAGWQLACKNESYLPCRIGNPYPDGADENVVTKDANNWTYNCWVNKKIEDYYVPLLEEAMKETKERFDDLIHNSSEM